MFQIQKHLKEFRDTIGNKLCYFEERPTGKGWEHSEIAGNADEIENTEDILEKFCKGYQVQDGSKSIVEGQVV